MVAFRASSAVMHKKFPFKQLFPTPAAVNRMWVSSWLAFSRPETTEP